MYEAAAWSIKNLEYVTNIDRCLQESPWEVRRSSGVAAPPDTAHPHARSLPGAGRTHGGARSSKEGTCVP